MKRRAFGQRLKMIRTRCYPTQTALGLRTGISQNRISNWELGYAYPDAEMLSLLADAFGCCVDEILGRSCPGMNENEARLLDKLRMLDDDGLHTVEAVIDSQLLRLGRSDG